MPPVVPALNYTTVLKELEQFQASLFDKSSTYSKVIIGLGYGGFFATWSATKAQLSPRLLVSSALCVTISLVFFVVFEIYQTMIISKVSIEFAKAVDNSPYELPAALEAFRNRTRKLTKPLLSSWIYIFSITVVAGLSGAGILVYAFVRSLLKI